MDKSQMFPFVRNRYYYGKMLTSADFTAEQQYVNAKHAFMNQMTLGTGVLCGLGVYNLDDLSILIESGAAIDQEGREIVAEESVVRKLASIQGFEGIDSEVMSLYIRYREEQTQPVYAGGLSEGQQEYENNRIEEGYELYLEDGKKGKKEFSLDSEFFVETRIIKTEALSVKLRMPAHACKGKRVKLELIAASIGQEPVNFAFAADLRIPVFVAEDGSHNLRIEVEDQEIPAGKEKIYEYWIYTESADVEESHILLEPGTGRVTSGKETLHIEETIDLSVIITGEKPEELVKKQMGRTSLEILFGRQGRDGVRLADIHITRTPAASVIDRVEAAEADTYITLPSRDWEKEQYLKFYQEGRWTNPALSGTPKSREEPAQEKKKEEIHPWIESGILEIPLESRMKKGKVCFSQEIPHGLGPGNVYVAVGISNTGDKAGSRREIKNTVYGNMSLFAEQDMGETWVETAVKVFHEKGTFQAAVKIRGEQKTVLLTVPWTAVRVPEKDGELLEAPLGTPQIIPVTPTFRMKPKEKHYFEVRFANLEECGLAYELVDAEGGVIEADGTYTAPSKAGVYEIRISVQEQPDIGTYVYAIVERESVL